MTDHVIVNRDKTRLLPPFSSEKGWQITRKEAVELGLLDTPEKPTQQRRTEQKRRTPKPKDE